VTELEFIGALILVVVIATVILLAMVWVATPPTRTFRPKKLPQMRPGETPEQFWARVEDDNA
jgi:hypothetical protein